MVGTLIGMVQMFANMTDPSKLGPYMAIALLATFYGAALANLVCLPIADKLHLKLVDEEINRTLTIDGESRPNRGTGLGNFPSTVPIPYAKSSPPRGLPGGNVYMVAGKADNEPLFPDNPYISPNRRVTITLMREAPPLPPDLNP
jgi:hypothetical protein